MTSINPYDQAAEHAQRVQADAENFAAPQAPEDSTPDSSPALASVAPQFDTPDSDVDLSDMPELKSMAGMRPSARAHVRMQLIGIVKLLPESLVEKGQAGEVDEDSLALSDLDPESMDTMLTAIEDLALERAKDAGEMEQWLIRKADEVEPMGLLMAVFNRIQEQLGN